MSGERVFVGVRAVAWMWTSSTFAFLSLELPAGSTWCIEDGASFPAYKSNVLIARFLEQRHYDALLFLDSDMVPPPDTVTRLLAHGRDVCSALYFTRVGPPEANCGTGAGPTRRLPSALFPVEWIGMGCCLIRRRVLEAIPAPWCENIIAGCAGEDLDLCRKIRAHGFEITVDPALVAGHVGDHEVGLADALRAGTVWRAEDHDPGIESGRGNT